MKKIFSSKKRVAAIGVITAATMVGGGMAVAYWTSSGTDTDTATVGTSSLFAVEIIPVTTAALSPGGPTNTYSVKVTNPGSGVQRLNQVVVSVTGTNDGTDPIEGCTAADFEVNGQSGQATIELGPPEDLAADDAYTFTNVVLQMVDTRAPQDACKDAIVDLEAVAS